MYKVQAVSAMFTERVHVVPACTVLFRFCALCGGRTNSIIT